MTIEELERELEGLADPQEEDERLRLAIRARLGEQVLVGDRRRLRPVSGMAGRLPQQQP
jgi:hypothetical protein